MTTPFKPTRRWLRQSGPTAQAVKDSNASHGNTTTTNHFLKTGLLQKSWGARQYPVEYAYDAQGRMTNMVTWQAFDLVSGSGASPASTTWLYDSYEFVITNGIAAPASYYRLIRRIE
jgi:hypothetical protein